MRQVAMEACKGHSKSEKMRDKNAECEIEKQMRDAK